MPYSPSLPKSREVRRYDFFHTPVLGIIGKERARGERVSEVGARGIACLRDRNTVVVDGSAGSELAQQPAVRELIIQNDGIARRIRAVRKGKVGPQGSGIGRAEESVPGLVIHGEYQVIIST